MEAAPLAAISAVFSWRGACPAAMFDASGDFTASAVNPLISASTLASLFSFYWRRILMLGTIMCYGPVVDWNMKAGHPYNEYALVFVCIVLFHLYL